MSVPVLPDPRERADTGGVPCAGGACPAPGGTPTFLALSPLAALRRRAVLTGRLPHGRLRSPSIHAAILKRMLRTGLSRCRGVRHRSARHSLVRRAATDRPHSVVSASNRNFARSTVAAASRRAKRAGKEIMRFSAACTANGAIATTWHLSVVRQSDVALVVTKITTVIRCAPTVGVTAI